MVCTRFLGADEGDFSYDEKDVHFHMDRRRQASLYQDQEAIANATVSAPPDFEKDFILYCYASEHTLSYILT